MGLVCIRLSSEKGFRVSGLVWGAGSVPVRYLSLLRACDAFSAAWVAISLRTRSEQSGQTLWLKRTSAWLTM